MFRFPHFLIATTSVLGIPAFAAEPIVLSPKLSDSDLARVSVELEAGGNAAVRTDAQANSPAASETQLPISVVASLQYDERRLGVDPSRPRDGATLAVRYYDKAEAVIKVDQGGIAPRLSENNKVIVVNEWDGRPMLRSASGPMPRPELDLVDVIGNSLVLDQLLPSKPVAQGDKWPHEASLMGRLLTLETVSSCEVESVLDEYNASFAKIRMTGVIHGTADGTPTQQEVRAVYLFDRRLQRIARFNLAVKEQRSIGSATPGLDAVAKLQIKIEPLEAASGEPPAGGHPAGSGADDARLRLGGNLPPFTPEALNLAYESPAVGFRVEHDRQWFVTGENREAIALRRVDRGELLAHCTIASLPAKSAGRQTSLEQFQADVARSLGKNFGSFVSSRQWINSRGHYCYEVIARGMVEEFPIEWHYYLIAQESGHRIALTTTVEGPKVARLAQADRALVEVLALIPPRPVTAQAPTDAAPANK